MLFEKAAGCVQISHGDTDVMNAFDHCGQSQRVLKIGFKI
jgi:hypothetical protein